MVQAISKHIIEPIPRMRCFIRKRYTMFGLFKKKTEREKLEAEYGALIKKSYELSHSNRAESDRVQAQAQEVLQKLEALED